MLGELKGKHLKLKDKKASEVSLHSTCVHVTLNDRYRLFICPTCLTFTKAHIPSQIVKG